MQHHPTVQRAMPTEWSQIQLHINNISKPFAEFTQSIAHQCTKSSGLCKILTINLIKNFYNCYVCTYAVSLKA